jgi:endonuclease/exonuclease/phosphatase family metal-dependent hydrolase
MLKVASYNIHSCVGRGGELDPRRVADVILEMGADIVALQEVDARHRAGAYFDQWVFLAEAVGCACIPGISLRTHRNIFGNALLTCRPIRNVRLHDISVNRREPRGAIDAEIDAGGENLRIVATHFGLRAQERRQQSELLLSILDAQGSASTQLPTLLLGDFNDWRPNGKTIRHLARAFHPANAPATFPARYPLFSLDRIFARGNIRLESVAVHRSALARRASDHLPVSATVSWLARRAAA